jgi:hypothetical protein
VRGKVIGNYIAAKTMAIQDDGNTREKRVTFLDEQGGVGQETTERRRTTPATFGTSVPAQVEGKHAILVLGKPGGPFFETVAVIFKAMHVTDNRFWLMGGQPALCKEFHAVSGNPVILVLFQGSSKICQDW